MKEIAGIQTVNSSALCTKYDENTYDGISNNFGIIVIAFLAFTKSDHRKNEFIEKSLKLLTLALVPGRFLRIIVVMSAIFMVQITYLLETRKRKFC